jgi:quercetin dioxygenase-like cupin family protein
MVKKAMEQSFGARFKRLRQAEGLSVDELAGEVGFKSSRLAAIENDSVLPSVAEIITLSRRLSVEPSVFTAGGGKEQAQKKRKDALERRAADYAYKSLTGKTKDKRLMAFEVTIDPQSEHHKVANRHPGEEFVYVLSGRLNITVGKKASSLKTGKSIHFDSGLPHKLKNPGKEPARLLVVVYNP